LGDAKTTVAEDVLDIEFPAIEQADLVGGRVRKVAIGSFAPGDRASAIAVGIIEPALRFRLLWLSKMKLRMQVRSRAAAAVPLR
jgi:hypothetical protein